jgi:hypothetical protein
MVHFYGLPACNTIVMAGLVPAISLRLALCIPKRDARHKAGHDSIESVHSISGQTLRTAKMRLEG